MRINISLVVVAVALAGSLGTAAAQYYPPPPSAYPPPPPPPGYPYPSSPPGPYSNAPLPPPDDGAPMTPAAGAYGHAPYVYRDASGAPYDPQTVAGQDEGDGYPPASRPYFVPDGRYAPLPMPSFGGEPVVRPPAAVAGAAASADVTGTVRSPAGATASPPQPGRGTVVAGLPPEDQPEQGPARDLPPQFRRQLVGYTTSEPAGTIIIDTPNTYLYLVLGNGKAMRYGIGVGREGFTWSGGERISRMSEWPDWHPPKEMIERQPYLPRFMAGGDGNPLGARALYLGNTLYRIHGTNQPSTIGTFVSSGCIRLTNGDIEDLYSRVSVGTHVVVLPGSASASVSSQSPIAR